MVFDSNSGFVVTMVHPMCSTSGPMCSREALSRANDHCNSVERASIIGVWWSKSDFSSSGSSFALLWACAVGAIILEIINKTRRLDNALRAIITPMADFNVLIGVLL